MRFISILVFLGLTMYLLYQVRSLLLIIREKVDFICNKYATEENKPKKAHSIEHKKKIAESIKLRHEKRKAAEQARQPEEEASKSVIFLDKK